MNRHAQEPDRARHRRDPAADPGRQHLRDRAGDQAGGDRPLRRAAAHPQPLPAERAVRPHRRGPRRRASRSSSRSSGSTSASSRSTWRTSRCSRPTSSGSRSTPSPATGSSIRCGCTSRRGTEEQVSEPAQADPRLGAAQRARPAAVRRLAQPRARPDDGQYPERAQPRRPPIWRGDRRRPHQARRPAQRHAAQFRLSADATARQQEARSIEAQGFKQAQIIRAEADAEAAAHLCRRRSTRIPNSTISTGRCSPTRRASSARQAGDKPARADQHHPLAEQRISAAVPGQSMSARRVIQSPFSRAI